MATHANAISDHAKRAVYAALDDTPKHRSVIAEMVNYSHDYTRMVLCALKRDGLAIYERGARNTAKWRRAHGSTH